MKMAAKFFLIPILFLIVSKAEAKIEWNEPEVVPEKLVRKNRRVLRFSGITTPGAQVRIRKNRLKLYLDNGKIRLAKIPQKNRIQFPVVADRDGAFAFDLYLPTVAVEIPIEMRIKKRWKPYTLNFRVPDEGTANDFQAIEESFKAQDARMESLDRSDNYYSRKNDQGMLIQDRGGKKGYEKSSLQAWGGLGLSYFSTTVDSPANNTNRSGSALVIPSWRLGVSWDYSKSIKLSGAIRSTSGSTDEIGDSNTTGRDFNWLGAQASVLWYSDMLTFGSKKLAFDFGFQLQSLPFFRQRAGFINETYFDNSTYNIHIGAHYESRINRIWEYQVYGRYLYPISSGDSFSIESSFPLNFEFGGGIQRALTRGLAFGVFTQLHYFSMDVSYVNNTTIDTDLNLMLLTLDARLIANF